MEQMSTEWVQDGLRPWATRIEQTVDDQLLDGDEDVFAQFLFEDLLRGDLEARTNHYTAMFERGIFSRNEIRSRENLNPIEGPIGVERYQSLQLLKLDENGNPVQPAQPAPTVN